MNLNLTFNIDKDQIQKILTTIKNLFANINNLPLLPVELTREFQDPDGTRKEYGIICGTGDTCPESGIWKSRGPIKTTINLTETETFPPYAGLDMEWELIQLS